MSTANTEPRLEALIAIFALLAVAGCNKNVSNLTGTGASAEMAMAAGLTSVQAATPSDTLAYEHTVSIETSQELLPIRLREIEAACQADRASGCAILEVSLHSQQDLPSGSIRMRLASAGVEPIVALSSKDSAVTARNSRAEDLAEPVADVDRQLSLLTLHRDRLTEFMNNKELKIEQLITVSKELASVQSQIESFSTTRANLQRRIDTDLLTINLSLPRQVYIEDRRPVMDAFRDFGSEFRNAVGAVIRFLAVLLPWLVIILPGLFLIRLFWRWIGRKLTRREQPA